MKKRIYRAVGIKQVDTGALVTALAGSRVVVGADVAKENMVAAIADAQGAVMTTVKWRHPIETPDLLAFLGRIGVVEVTMEPI